MAPGLATTPSRLSRSDNARGNTGPLKGVRELPGFFRRPYGDGWALAGDAGYHKHPLSAQGITDAFRDADFLSQAIDEGLSGRRAIQEALAEYERQRIR
jgi:2-polyprenyl-6-methoxyphenol hydroxylase-like FAD-dependent oxidoreductase